MAYLDIFLPTSINYFMGFKRNKRIVANSHQIYDILVTTHRGGNNDSDARRYSAYSRGGSSTAQSLDNYSAKVHHQRTVARGESRWALEGQEECHRAIYRQEQHRGQKIKAAFNRRQLKNLVAYNLSLVVQTSDKLLVSRYLFVKYAIRSQVTQALGNIGVSVCMIGTGWQVGGMYV